MTKPKKIQVTFPMRWKAKGGIPKQIDQRVWKPGVPQMMEEHPQHPETAAMAQRIADAGIYKMCSRGG